MAQPKIYSKVYFGKSSFPGLERKTEEYDTGYKEPMTYNVHNLHPNTTYFWRIDSVHKLLFFKRNVSSPVWSFNTTSTPVISFFDIEKNSKGYELKWQVSNGDVTIILNNKIIHGGTINNGSILIDPSQGSGIPTKIIKFFWKRI